MVHGRGDWRPYVSDKSLRPQDPDPIESGASVDDLIQVDSSIPSDSREFSDSPPPPDDRDELIQQLLREVRSHKYTVKLTPN